MSVKFAVQPRRAMTDARKRRIWEREGGKCWMCGKLTEVTGPSVRYDHRIPLELTGTDDDSNIFPLHRDPCDIIKCKADAARIAKAKRQAREKGQQREDRKPSRIANRGFQKPPEGFRTKWPKRGFAKKVKKIEDRT